MNFRFLTLFLLAFQVLFSQNNLIPKPQTVEIRSGFFVIPNSEKINLHSENFKKTLFEINLFNNNGMVCSKSDFKNSQISYQRLQSNKSQNKEEYYKIEISQNRIILSSFTDKGRFYAINTLMSIFDEYRDTKKIPCLVIEDFPKFQWRGMHLDVARHFFTKKEIEKYIDYLAMYKFNVFHWHLTEDQGWRIEIKKYPKLTEIGGFRNGSMIGHYREQRFDNQKYGGYYTQEEIKEVVKYASDRHITVVPEIEMPGHAVAAIASYPYLSCTGKQLEVGKIWGVYDDVFCPKEETFKFLEDVLTEVMALFPSKIIHIGGDEVPKTRWKNCPYCQALIKNKGLKDEHELQSYFIQRIEKFLNAKGRKIIGWDEILEGGLAPNASVMSWRGTEGGIAAAKQKHDVVMTPLEFCYLNRYQGLPKSEPLASGGYITLEKAYQFNPMPESLSKDEQKYILGAQGSLWTEYIKDFDYVQYMIFPRMMALSEVVWGTSQPKEYVNFQQRVISQMRNLDELGINYSRALYNVEPNTEIPKNKYNGVLLSLKGINGAENIYFTTDVSEPNLNSEKYQHPIPINKNTTIKAAYFEGGTMKSKIMEQQVFVSKSTGKKITLKNLPDSKYFVKGAETLVDGIKGNPANFNVEWAGFLSDIDATIELPEETEISSLKINFINSPINWIYLPKSIKLQVSETGKVYELSSEEIKAKNGIISLNFPKTKTKKISFIAKNIGVIPKDSEGAGNDAWLFVDEISLD